MAMVTGPGARIKILIAYMERTGWSDKDIFAMVKLELSLVQKGKRKQEETENELNNG